MLFCVNMFKIKHRDNDETHQCRASQVMLLCNDVPHSCDDARHKVTFGAASVNMVKYKKYRVRVMR
jgi:hypothetical protein